MVNVLVMSSGEDLARLYKERLAYDFRRSRGVSSGFAIKSMPVDKNPELQNLEFLNRQRFDIIVLAYCFEGSAAILEKRLLEQYEYDASSIFIPKVDENDVVIKAVTDCLAEEKSDDVMVDVNLELELSKGERERLVAGVQMILDQFTRDHGYRTEYSCLCWRKRSVEKGWLSSLAGIRAKFTIWGQTGLQRALTDARDLLNALADSLTSEEKAAFRSSVHAALSYVEGGVPKELWGAFPAVLNPQRYAEEKSTARTDHDAGSHESLLIK